MFQKVLILLIYLFIVFLVFRIWGIYSYILNGGANYGSGALEPIRLNSRQLRSVLEYRGISYTGILEKTELAVMVEASGQPSNDELLEAEFDDSNETLASLTNTEPNTIIFTSRTHFNELVEQSEDSIWLIQLIGNPYGYRPVDDGTWAMLVRHLSPFGIKFGIVDCHINYGLCRHKKWTSSRLLLSISIRDEETQDATVVHHIYPKKFQRTSFLKWLYDRVGSRVVRVESTSQLANWFSEESSCVREMCLLLVSTLTLPPFFLSALAVKFGGRVRVGITSPANYLTTTQTNDLSARDVNGDYILIHSATRVPLLTRRRRSHISSNTLTSSRIANRLRWLAPDLNDFFVFSLAIVNMAAVLSIFDLKASPLQTFIHFFWTLLKYNMFFLGVWFVLLGIMNMRLTLFLVRPFLSRWRQFVMSSIGQIFLNDLLVISKTTTTVWINFGLFFLFNLIIHIIRRRYWPTSLHEPEPWSEWFRINRPVLILNPGRPTIGLGYRSHSPVLSYRIRALLHELNIKPEKLVSTIPYDYIFDLPILTYGQEGLKLVIQMPDRYPRTMCFRCKCVAKLGLKSLRSKLQYRPCSRCGFDGFRFCEPVLPARPASVACAICLEVYTDKEEICLLPCRHYYHRSCILSWILTDPNQTCPCCRWPAYLPNN